MKKQLTQKEMDILFSDFPESNVDFDRETIEKFSPNIRGSVRLATGRYYTQKEMEERAKKAFSIKLY
jgi:hypothetical protein